VTHFPLVPHQHQEYHQPLLLCWKLQRPFISFLLLSRILILMLGLSITHAARRTLKEHKKQKT
jgi:hypothetical protein